MLKFKKFHFLLGPALAVSLVAGFTTTSVWAANMNNGSESDARKVYSLEGSSVSSAITQRVEETAVMQVAEEVVEHTTTVDISTFLTMEPTDVSARAFDSISMDVPSGKGMIYTKALSMEAGQTINVNVAVSPASSSVRIGIVDSNGKYRYVTAGSGSVNHNFAISERGTYYFCVENASSYSVVSVTGFLTY